MPFIDNLAYSLFAISFAGFMFLYTIPSMYLAYRKKQKNFAEILKSASIPLGIIGVYMFITALIGQSSWPLPGSYNILFFDPLISFGMLLIAFALAVKFNVKLEYVGVLGLLFGIMVIVYGINGYNIGLTSAPLGLLGMYLAFGLSGIFSLPISLIADRLPKMKGSIRTSWQILLIIFWLLILVSSLLSAYIAILAIPAHLLSAP